ncbi:MULTISPECIES: hypothetical protein [unclassified Paenibacillus]|uniref:hypothetical protein n=1 Tax=unclassified Paenibacillus TaxID=185978 RepID=UPI00020D7982|nr:MULTISPECIES: hypothetical protein [unclassified Paenibacillus]EGL14945.1 hypothetical protein HMPREF9413_1241 [Paenibacillus sp. HGF7]EPD92517.1 hypothetical protein HMPREF1207_00288 [Paenibacillus sp. HGH0039]
MENKRKLLEEFFELEDYNLENEITEIITRFRKYNPYEVFWLINSLIMDNTRYVFENRDKRVSPKLVNRLFYLYKKNSVIKNNTKIKNRSNELKWLRKKFVKIVNYYCMEQFNQKEEQEDIHMSLRNFHSQNFINYHFDYPNTSWFQYLRALEINSKVIDTIFIKDNLTTLEIEKGLLICILYDFIYQACRKNILNDLLYEKEKYKFESFLTSFSVQQFSKVLRRFGIKEKEFINRFFPILRNENEVTLSYPTDKYYREEFSLGICHKDRIFFPRSNFILDEFWNYILEHEEMKGGKGKRGRKDDFVEEYTIMLLKDFFGKESVYNNLYDENGDEQDIIVLYGEYTLCFECKSEVLKEPFRDSNKSDTRMKQNFDRVIQKAYIQGWRVKNNINNKNSKYYNSDKKYSRKIILDLCEQDHTKVLKICITINNYLNLSNRVNKYLEFKDDDKDYPWVVDIFSLEHIFNKVRAINRDEKYFINYVQDRIKSYLGVQALGAEELECFGYYLRYGKFNNALDGWFMTNLGNGYTTFVLDYIPSPEINLMQLYFLELASITEQD